MTASMPCNDEMSYLPGRAEAWRTAIVRECANDARTDMAAHTITPSYRDHFGPSRNESLAGLLLAINSFPLAEPHVIITEWRQYHAC